jgi:glycosyltransferase involved in cell wall biosynthesis
MYVYTRRLFGSEYSGGKVKGFFFWIHEAIAVKSISLTNGFVLMSSAYDAKELVQLTHIPQNHVHAVCGGVDFNFFESVPSQPFLYDAVFIGRFKPQKCIEELIEIWSDVIKSKLQWKLAIIGGGPLEKKLRAKVRNLGMSDSISFLGVLDGIEKVKILKSSRIFVSASVYDTGNIALDEAQACSIPGIIYDLPSMPYDKGVIHIPPFDSHAFAKAIIRVGTDDALHRDLSKGAKLYASP